MKQRRDRPAPDDDEGRPGGPIRDPILHVLPAGAEHEPLPGELHKSGVAEGMPRRKHGAIGLLQVLGPGLITGASDDDPSGIGTYSQAGSQFGYGLLWTALFTFPLMVAVQELCARIALHTGVGLGTALRRRFPTWLVALCIVALFLANTINVGADLGAVAAGLSLLTRGWIRALWLIVPVAVVIMGLQLFLAYRVIFKVFKWLTVVLFAYVVTGFLIHPDARQILAGTFVPHIELTGDYIAVVVAVLGTTISPYLFFWQASSEVDEMRAAGKTTEAARHGVRSAELKSARLDIVAGMFMSNLVMYFIIVTTAAALHAHGKTDVQTAAQAAEALSPLAGQWSFVLFSIGLIGTGLLAVPILSGSAAYAVKEFLGLKGALADKPAYRPTFYAIAALSTAAGVAINLLGFNPIHALFVTAIINGLVAPALLALIVILGATREVMGARTSGPLSVALTGAATVAMTAAAVALVATLLGRLIGA